MTQSKFSLGFKTLNEETNNLELQIQGELPSWLNGVLLRTGPAKFEIGSQSYNHWFDGLAMLFAFRFSDNKVIYSNRFLKSNSYLKAMEKDEIVKEEIGTNPKRPLLERLKAVFNLTPTDNCNVSINKFSNAMVALTETRLAFEFDPLTLETLNYYNYDKKPGDHPSGRMCTAHPHFDFDRWCHFSYMMKFGLGSKIQIFRMGAERGQQKIIREIPIKHPIFMHSFGMTENYLILTEFPFVLNIFKLLFSSESIIKNYKWKPKRGVLFIIIEKDTGKIVKKVQTNAFFAFHHINAFENGDSLLVDLITYPDPSIIYQFNLENLRKSSDPVQATGMPTRFYIDLNKNTEVKREQLSSFQIEIPRINYRKYVGRPYRFIYGVGKGKNSDNNSFLASLIKVDLKMNKDKVWSSEDSFPGEPVFVAAPEAKEEDEGIILSVVLDIKKSLSYLIVLDSKTWKELAHMDLPHHIPFGFHGNYFPSLTGSNSFKDLHR
ncbi:MAG: Dioxygenase [Promethearchaeota archaeon]|nr:MAG: Dioxygenase [Candidatus Lokiarchaeota archaeon]